MNIIRTSLIALGAVFSLSAAGQLVTDLDLTRVKGNPGNIIVSYNIDPSAAGIPSNSEVVLTPVLHFGADSIELKPTVIAGRNAYLAHKRNDDLAAGTDLVRTKGDAITRRAELPWQNAMVRSELTFRTETIGCRCKEEGRGKLPQTLAVNFEPKHFDLIIPRDQLAALEKDIKDVVKTREVSKSAHVNYKVGSTVLLPDFESNPAELKAILATIDSVRDDKDLTVDHVEIHGYASPEGTYALNTRLAAGRTEALRKYVDARYNFGKNLVASSTPEDWAGLRKWVEASDLHEKAAVLRIIDSKLSPDAKDDELRTGLPNTYKILLWEAYPSLRRSDYTIKYTVRNFTKPETIARLLKTNPDKLSMEEVMLLARTYKVDSPEREELALTAARLFPNDWRAQLNGAFVALKHNDLNAAEGMLKRSGDSPLADYGRGVLMLYRKDYKTARPLLEKAAKAGVQGATEALECCEE
ncbi:MAG: hypothetical protein K2G67_01545 [Muribaculaceae bacterium]|nr:hypothetical protein [Muribaculaceae bacterium]